MLHFDVTGFDGWVRTTWRRCAERDGQHNGLACVQRAAQAVAVRRRQPPVLTVRCWSMDCPGCSPSFRPCVRAADGRPRWRALACRHASILTNRCAPQQSIPPTRPPPPSPPHRRHRRTGQKVWFGTMKTHRVIRNYVWWSDICVREHRFTGWLGAINNTNTHSANMYRVCSRLQSDGYISTAWI